MPGPFPPRSQPDRVHRLATRMGGVGGVGGSTPGVGPVLRPIRPLGLPVPVVAGSAGGTVYYAYSLPPTTMASGAVDARGASYDMCVYTSPDWTSTPTETGPAGTVTRS